MHSSRLISRTEHTMLLCLLMCVKGCPFVCLLFFCYPSVLKICVNTTQCELFFFCVLSVSSTCHILTQLIHAATPLRIISKEGSCCFLIVACCCFNCGWISCLNKNLWEEKRVKTWEEKYHMCSSATTGGFEDVVKNDCPFVAWLFISGPTISIE